MLARSFVASKGVRYISLGWILFIAENLVLSENRSAIIDWQGEYNYHMFYSVCSSIACGSIAYGYIRHGHLKDPIPGLIRRSRLAIITGFILQSLGYVGLSQLFPKLQMPVKRVAAEETTSPSPHNNPKKSEFLLQPQCPFDFKQREKSAGLICKLIYCAMR